MNESNASDPEIHTEILNISGEQIDTHPPQDSPTVVNTQTSPPDKQEKRLMSKKVIIMIGILLAASLIFGVFIFSIEKDEKQKNIGTPVNIDNQLDENRKENQVEEDSIVYDNSEYKIRFKHPQNWKMSNLDEVKEIEGLENTVVQFELDNDKYFIGFVNLSIETFEEENYTLEEYAGVSDFEKDESIDIVESVEVVLAGKPAYKIVYDEVWGDGDEVRTMIISMVDDDKGYFFGYIHKKDLYTENITSFLALIDTIEIY